MLFGRAKNDRNKWHYDKGPASLHEVSQYNHVFDPNRLEEAISGLQKIHSFLNKKFDAKQVTQVKRETILPDARAAERTLSADTLTPEEAAELDRYTTFDDESGFRKRNDLTRAALMKLQKLYLKNSKQLSSTEQTVIIMLTDIAIGTKNIQDIYYVLHQKDQTTTRQCVEDLVKEAVRKLTAEKK